MHAIVNTGPGQLAMQELPTPIPGPGQVRVRVAACGICATDLEMIDGWERTSFPAVPGHEWSGVVDAVGAGVPQELVGKPCVAENVLSDGGEVGFEHAGGYGEYLITEARNLQVLPEGFPLDQAALIEPLAVAVRGMHRLDLRDRSGALVFGDGPIGLLLVALLAREGVADVCVVGGRNYRLALAAGLAGGEVSTLNYHGISGDLTEGVRERLGDGFSNVLEASGSSSALESGMRLAASGGRVLLIGDYGDARASMPWNTILHKELSLIGSNASAGAWSEAVRLATSGEVPLDRLISHRLPVTSFAEGIALVEERTYGCTKVVMEW